MNKLTSGTVKWYNDGKGYGFLQCPESDAVFVHYSAITGNGFKTLAEGQQVEFELVVGIKGLEAKNVVKDVG